jgi:energy-coupling factor transporter transmembrane protein EcfT
MKTGTPIEKLHVITKFFMIAAMSVLALYMFDISVSKGGPDILGLIFLLTIVFVLLIISGTTKYLANSYLLLALPVPISEFIWWLFFNWGLPGPKEVFYLWPGFFPIGLSTIVLVGVFGVVYYRTRSIVIAIIPAVLLWWITVMAGTFDFSTWTTWLRLPIGAIASFTRPSWSVTVASSKALGFAVLIYTSFLFLLTTRDTEIAGAMRQLGLSFKKAFFIALIFRSLNTLLIDYENIRMAQTARAAGVNRKSVFSKIIDLAYVSIPLVATMIRRSTEMGVALYARGFEASKKVTSFKETKGITYVDVTVIAILSAFLIYEVVLGHSINNLLIR